MSAMVFCKLCPNLMDRASAKWSEWEEGYLCPECVAILAGDGIAYAEERDIERLVERGTAIVRPLIAQSGRIVARAEQMYRDMTGATTPLHSADMGEKDRQWWYRIARESIEQEGR